MKQKVGLIIKLSENVSAFARRLIEPRLNSLLQPLVLYLSKKEVHPNILTITGLFLNGIAAFLFYKGFFKSAGFLTLFAGIFDMLDGKVARTLNKKSVFGALLDSTIDRYSELITYTALVLYYKSNSVFIFTVMLSAIGSTMVSYIRARAEALNIECKVGIMQRPERVFVLGVGALLCGSSKAFLIPLLIIGLYSNITAIQRLLYAKKQINT